MWPLSAPLGTALGRLRPYTPSVAFAALLLSAALGAGQVTAHAVLLRTLPPTGQTLTQPPVEVRLLFSEPIDPVFSSVRVLNSRAERIDRRDSYVDPTDDRQLVVSLPSGLSSGIYTVYWRSLSTIDIHPDEGRYPLYVGVSVPAATTAEGIAIQNRNTGTPETRLARWLFYAAASLFGGVLATWKLVIGGVLVDDYSTARPAARRLVYRLALFGGVLLVAGTLFAALAQAAAAADVPVLSAVGEPLANLLGRGRFAAIWWPRLGLEVAAVLLLAIFGLEGMSAEIALAMMPAVLLTTSLTSHGAALGSGAALGVTIDWLHLLGAAVWVGGIASLLVVLPVTVRSGAAPWLTVRFGRLALLALAVVLLSGTAQAVIEIGSWSALVATLYGQLVLLKVCLLLAMLGLAGFVRWSARHAHSQAVTASSAGRFGLSRAVRAEFVLGLAVLAVAAVLTGTPPSRGS